MMIKVVGLLSCRKTIHLIEAVVVVEVVVVVGIVVVAVVVVAVVVDESQKIKL
jgi:hypothetical protein